MNLRLPGGERFSTLEDAARLAGHRRWFETRLFEVVGAWVEVEAEPRAKLLLRAHSFRHAWHADIWSRCLPVPGDAGDPTVPASPGAAEFLDTLAAITGSGQTLERLVGLYRVVMPELVRAYEEHLEGAVVTSEGPTMRWLRLLIADEIDACQAGERLLETLLAGSADPDRAGSRQADLEAGLAAVGGLGLRVSDSRTP